MIFAIMGNHGAGKSFLVNRITDSYDSINLVSDPRRLARNPVIMECVSPDTPPLAVIGNYQIGHYSGIDSGRFAGRMDEIFVWIRAYDADGWHVMFEGMLVAGMWRRASELPNLQPVYLNISAEECALSVAHRKSTTIRRNKHTD
jgi:hypothetical protein